jgi:transglutaminase-like putative cysteine protease
MPIFYKTVTFVLALTGCASLVISGELNPLMALSGVAMLPGYYGFLRHGRYAPGWAVGLFSLAALVVFSFDSYVSGDVFLAVAHLTIAFHAIKSFDLKEPWDHLQVYFVSLLQLIIASELTHSVAFAFIFIVFILLLVTAMVLSHFLKEGRLGKVGVAKPVMAITLLCLFMTILFFVAIPRTPFRFFAKGHLRGIKSVGFSERVDFGSFGSVKLDPTVVMRVEISGDPGVSLYWRGVVLDYFDGNAWRNTSGEKRRVLGQGGEHVISSFDRDSALVQTIYLEPLDSDVIFGLPVIKAVATDSRLILTDNAGAVYFRRKLSRSTNYKVFSIPGTGLPGGGDTRYLQLPGGMEKIAGLAKDAAAGTEDDYERAGLIERFLKSNYTYSLSTSEPPPGVGPIEDFLFRSRRGYCEHYATSMVLMLRGLGIPARVVNGFYGGDRNEYGDYVIVRQSNAHSWVEAYVKGSWMRFDPTPAEASERPSGMFLILDSLRMKWFRYVVGFSAADQEKILNYFSYQSRASGGPAPGLKNMKPLLLASAVVVVLICVFFVFKTARRRSHGIVSARYISLKKLLRKKGGKLGLSATPAEVKAELRRFGPDDSLGCFIVLYEEYRFGRREMTEKSKKEYEKLYSELKKKLRGNRDAG